MPKARIRGTSTTHSATPTESGLIPLSGEFDALLARMHTPAARAGMRGAFQASPKQLGRAAVAVARKRRRRIAAHDKIVSSWKLVDTPQWAKPILRAAIGLQM
jgi:hypothetical protein